MFNGIARSYDFLNHFLSFGIDVWWRKKMIRMASAYSPAFILDVATGTGDLAVMATKMNPEMIVGVDLSEEMLKEARIKIEKEHLGEIIEFQEGDVENLNFGDNSFDMAMSAFGVRNFENLDLGLAEIYRVLKEGGTFFVLEFSKPTHFPIKQFYSFYSFHFLPFLGKLISKDRRAYMYLPESIAEFPDKQNFCSLMERAGFKNCFYKPLTFGIVSIYFGVK